ncbi:MULTISPECIES: hypothetical protein [unclassified Rhizobium]|uniref:hypothetical protein n=1 Tax=unclassified Rhizobium TaxID=2613769 RepID=UPI0007F13572|nr:MULTISPECIES: hypothetical protein [unclassified Rhizobium]ANK83988.1 hypothetical protein AMK02_CH00338 [Rhizobium sp. N731]ANL14236.1 hypothetical protein AMJ97_CH00338 [Rhizobium sp. N1314]
MLNAQARLLCTAVLVLSAIGLRQTAAMAPCPSQKELLAKAEIVVEARVRSLSISPSGLITTDKDFPGQLVRAELEIKKVIKGKFAAKEAIVYGIPFPPGPFTELTTMALIYGYEGHDTFEWELSQADMDHGIGWFRINDCIYHKFPELDVGPR